mmetsp:Transcript_6954/g.12396  ORF Transcript_6954/g.12396 Transcript_6954/m.12396 type:complete len:809 (-) Transcript_6954:10-2436(-)
MCATWVPTRCWITLCILFHNVADVGALVRPTSARAGSLDVEVFADTSLQALPDFDFRESFEVFQDVRQRMWHRHNSKAAPDTAAAVSKATSLLRQKGHADVNAAQGPGNRQVIELLNGALLDLIEEIDNETLQCDAHTKGLQQQYTDLRMSADDAKLELAGLQSRGAQFSKEMHPSANKAESLRSRLGVLHGACKRQRSALFEVKDAAVEDLHVLQKTANATLRACSGGSSGAALFLEKSASTSSSNPSGQRRLLDPPPASDAPQKSPEAPLGDCTALRDHLDVMVRKQSRRVSVASQRLGLLDEECSEDAWEANQEMDIAEQLLAESQGQVSAAFSRKSTVRVTLEARTKQMKKLEEELKERQHNCKKTLDELANEMDILLEARQKLYLDLAEAVAGIPIQDCEVGEWISQPCSKTCVRDGEDPGYRSLSREVLLLPDTSTFEGQLGMSCPALLQTSTCAEAPCPIDCSMNEWSAWSACSSDCGGGDQYRTRTVEQVGLYGGLKCGSTMESQPCNVQACDADCETSDWSDWGGCSSRCRWSENAEAGRSHRVRQQLNEDKAEQCSDVILDQSKECNAELCSEHEGDLGCESNADIIFLLDHTGSVLKRQSNPSAGKEEDEVDRKWYVSAQKDLLEELVQRVMLVGENSSTPDNGLRLGMLSFGGMGRPRVLSKVSSTRQELTTGLSEEPGLVGESTVGRALLAALRLLEATPTLPGPPRHETVLLFTDGRVRDERVAQEATARLQLAGVRVMVALVQDMELPHAVSAEPVICSIATPPCADNVLRVRRWEDLLPQLDRFVAALCPSG